MTIFMSLGIFMITAMDINDTMSIMNPLLPNKIFTWWFLGILIIIIIIIMSLIIEGTYDYFLKRRPILLEKNHNKIKNSKDSKCCLFHCKK